MGRQGRSSPADSGHLGGFSGPCSRGWQAGTVPQAIRGNRRQEAGHLRMVASVQAATDQRPRSRQGSPRPESEGVLFPTSRHVSGQEWRRDR